MKTKIFSLIIPGMLILVGACKDPDASFKYKCGGCEIGDTVQFISTSVNSETFDWDFGDGNTSMEESPVYIYNESGTFDVRLTVSNNYGSEQDMQKSILIL